MVKILDMQPSSPFIRTLFNPSKIRILRVLTRAPVSTVLPLGALSTCHGSLVQGELCFFGLLEREHLSLTSMEIHEAG